MRDGNMVAVTKINYGQSDDKSDRYSLNCKPVSLSLCRFLFQRRPFAVAATTSVITN